jgi:hypothetical protein
MTSGDGYSYQARPPAGWYPDPQAPFGTGQQRYWDGLAWTELVIAGGSANQRPARRRWPLLLAAGAGIVMVALVAGVFLGRSGTPTDGASGPTTATPESAAPTAAPSATPTPKPTSELPQPQVTLGKPVLAALARYVRSYKAVWKVDEIDIDLPLGSQLEPRSGELRQRFTKLVDVAALDPGAQDPASNFGALLTAIERQVGAVETLVSELSDCKGLTGAVRIECELAIWEDQREISRAAQRVRAAYQLVNLPDMEESESESVRFDIGVGECFVQGTPFRVVSCDKPHDGEVFAEYVIPEPPGAVFPGPKSIAETAGRQCKRQFEGYVGVRLRFSELSIRFVYPTAESWTAGQRTISCVAALETAQLRESVRDSGR